MSAKGERTRQRLVTAARELLAETGGELVFGDVAARAGVSPGAPYRHFANKTALALAVVEEVFDEMEVATYQPTFEGEGPDWWSREKVRIARTVDFYFDDPLCALVIRGIAGDAAVTQARARRLDKQTRGAAKNVAVGRELGVVPAHIDPLMAGALLMGGVYQLLATALVAAKPNRRKVKAELQRFMARVLELPEENHA
ncbi:MAG: TetR/AcrR family transcriptional regulator [Myxococcota bacterium]